MRIDEIDPLDVMSTPPPSVSEPAASDLLQSYYRIDGTLEVQASERDQNYRVRSGAGKDFVLKIANSAEHQAVTDFQVSALLHLEKTGLELRVPRIVRTSSGDSKIDVKGADGRSHVARLLTWVPGIPAGHIEPRPAIAGQMGATLAELGRAFAAFDHEASGYPLLWDIKRAEHLSPLLENVTDPGLRRICHSHLLHFVASVTPRLSHCRSQVVFNDLHSTNVIVDPEQPGKIAGVIDFGDIVKSPLIIDVAVASAYLCRNDDAPLAEVFEFLSAYHSVTKLETREFELLPELMLMRNVLTIVIASWRAARYPENSDYIQRSVDHARQMIDVLARHDVSDLARDFENHCTKRRDRTSA